MDVGIVVDSPVGIARACVGSTVVWASVSRARDESAVGGERLVGERKKSRDQDFGVVPGRFFEPFFRSWRTLDCWRVRVISGVSSRRAGSIGTMDASGRLIISRSSFIVKAASRGPRRPKIDTCLTCDRDRSSKTGIGTSYFSKTETDVKRIRAMSRETFPFPIRDTCDSLSRGGGGGRDGCWVYQCTSDRADMQYGDGGSAW